MQSFENVLYFNSTRLNTLAVLNAFNNVKYWVTDSDGKDIEKIVPIKFGNYEKSQYFEDLDIDDLKVGNFNHVPRLILSFNGMTKETDRDTNKFNKISKRVVTPAGEDKISFSYNSLAYNFQFTLILQARGLNQAFMIVEQILPLFRPSHHISIKEYPPFDRDWETRVN